MLQARDHYMCCAMKEVEQISINIYKSCELHECFYFLFFVIYELNAHI